MDLPFARVDAFVDGPFSGNPAAVLRLDAWPDDATLLAIATQIGLPATAFVTPAAKDGAELDLRWFSGRGEIALCGHATLASGHVMLDAEPARNRVRFATRRAGVLAVERAEHGYRLDVPALVPVSRPLPAIVAALGAGAPVATLWHDRGYAVVVLPDEAAVAAVQPDFAALTKAGNISVIVTAPGRDTDIVSRVFVPEHGGEDAVTGSAHAVIATYWTHRLGSPAFTARQASPRGGRLHCRLDGERVELTGSCVTVMEGHFHLS
ncbi:PhzF family phenazine biosynthesis protein [Sphingomonas sp. KR1UV-12]|uniref:PhzF family phenazine biosynthesis protein n=1 Tax=Sphingomonas aurea TaxID=3063994 RepID=A0ABT9EMZ8_9SPHN|nr:PhzF family phenazine biosynthesis protein [Sphingomonas sp. KR1UV-12]MDP1028334.1 PhzF family phenazine biosynthesis protein [Sphingomonas sp. KR1UV-12]